MLSFIASVIDLRTCLLVAALTLLFKYISDKCGPDPRFRKINSQVPGPFRWPVFGNSLSFILAGKHGQAELQHSFEKKYGRIYRMWVGNHFAVQLSHPDDLEAIFTSSKILGKGEIVWPFNYCLGNGLFTTLSVPLWRKNRKRLQPYFTKDIIKHLAPEMNRAIYDVIENLKNYENGPEIEITDVVYDLSLDFVTRTACDFELSKNKKVISELKVRLESILDILSMQMFFPVLTTKFFRIFLDTLFILPARKYIMDLTKTLVADKLTAIQKGTYKSDGGPFSSELLLSSYNAVKDTGNENHMLEEISGIIFAAGEATMRTITFSLLMIAMHPEVQENVCKEIHEIFGDDDRPADFHDCEHANYLNRVMKETMRRFTLIPMLIRKADEDVTIGPYTFPAGTQFMVNVGGIHLNPEFYPNPHEFNPNNFSPEAIKKRHKYSYLPFSAGARNCLGKNMAELEVLLALLAILRKFSVHTTKTMKDLKMTFGLIERIEGGVWLSLKPRTSK